jgi:hypothetical protein
MSTHPSTEIFLPYYSPKKITEVLSTGLDPELRLLLDACASNIMVRTLSRRALALSPRTLQQTMVVLSIAV